MLRQEITFSSGVADRIIAMLVDRADRALYIAKSMGKNCVKPFSDERREHNRLEAALAGRFSLLEKAAHALTTVNVSEGGVLFHCSEPLSSGAFVKVTLSLPSSEPVECAVRVLRVVGARGGFDVGTEIIHMPRPHQRRFRLFLDQLRAGQIVLSPAPAQCARPSGPAAAPGGAAGPSGAASS